MADETLKEKIPPAKVAAQVLGTLSVTFLLSLTGRAGTLLGLAGGSAMSIIFPTLYEHFIRHSGSRIRARYQELLLTRMDPAAALAQARREQHEKAWRSVHWKFLGVTFALVLSVTTGAILITQAATGSPVSDIVRGTRHHHAAPAPPSPDPPPSSSPESSSPPPSSPPASPSTTAPVPVTSSPPPSPSTSAPPSPSSPVTSSPSPSSSPPATPSSSPAPPASGT